MIKTKESTEMTKRKTFHQSPTNTPVILFKLEKPVRTDVRYDSFYNSSEWAELRDKWSFYFEIMYG